MFGPVPVVRIEYPANEEYSGFLEINESDFDPKVHKLFSDVEKGLSISQIREALTAKGIEFPEDAKKAVLKALLEASQ